MTGREHARGITTTGVEPLDQRRVSVVCRSTRVDLSLPAHLELASVIPEVVDLLRDHVRAAAGPGSGVDVDSRMGGGTGGSWQLSRLAGGALAVSETLAQQQVHDGEILVLDHRPVPTPAPLFDDVVQGLTDPEVVHSPSWNRRDAALAAAATVGVASAAAALALVVQWSRGGGPTVPLVALVLALLGNAAVIALRGPDTPWPVQASAGIPAVGFTVLAALTVNPPPGGPGALFGAFSAGAGVALVLRFAAFRPVPGAYGRSAAYLAVGISSAVAAIGSMIVAVTGVPVATVGAGVSLAGLLLLTTAPAIAVTVARVPIPPVPAPGEDIEDGDLDGIDLEPHGRSLRERVPRSQLPTPELLRQRFLTSRSWLTALLASGGSVIALGALCTLSGPSSGAWAPALSLLLVVVLLLRGLGYSDRIHSGILVSSALVLAAGVLIGAALVLDSPVPAVVPAAVSVAAAAVVAAWVPPHVAPSPSVLRAVGVVEVISICLVVPLAVGAMDIYSLVRHR